MTSEIVLYLIILCEEKYYALFLISSKIHWNNDVKRQIYKNMLSCFVSTKEIPPNIIVINITLLINYKKIDLPINIWVVAVNKIIINVKNINIFLKFSEKSIIYSWFNTKRIINTMRHIFKNPFKNLFKQIPPFN